MYGIYENGVPVRVAIFNYVDDPSGATDVHAAITISGTTMPSSVKVKYLLAKTVVQKGGYTWAGQVCFRLCCFFSLGGEMGRRTPLGQVPCLLRRVLFHDVPPSVPFLPFRPS
jgi:hypothetical protein